MSHEHDDPTIDLIRWTFTVDPAQLRAVETYLTDQGLEVHARPDGKIVATWDEPEGDIDEVVEGLWEVHGTPFEVTHEEFSRLNLLAYQADDADDAGRAVA